MARLTLYAAIDLKDGACVRPKRGAMDQATIYATDPAGPRSGFRTGLVQRKIDRFSMR
jgi:phosphoribosylformimino-5-aminoimidazole carboxamide ribotide isomerase